MDQHQQGSVTMEIRNAKRSFFRLTPAYDLYLEK